MNVITKDGVAAYYTDDDVTLPSDGVTMIEITELPSGTLTRIGGGDINTDTATLYTEVVDIPEDYTGGKYLYNGSDFTLNPDYEE